ncbi:glycosyltransferase family 2 protein [Nitriliruptoraceae bacterium ZYF776]|nr:glycosyltransferase family 2 protein [Profundirhabdus halotolerans]
MRPHPALRGRPGHRGAARGGRRRAARVTTVAGDDVEVRSSPSFDAGPVPAVSVVIATYGRSGYLAELFARLADQDLAPEAFEVVVVDNGSTDDTWPVLSDLVATSPLRTRAVRLPVNRGPAGGRNAGAAHARAPVLAVTDDDCLPTPAWLPGIVAAFEDAEVVVAQGRVEPDPATRDAAGPWDHTIWVVEATPLFETCNVAYRRERFVAVGGFDEHDPLLRPGSGRAFGEDAVLGHELQRDGGTAAYVADAVVHHRCVPSSWRARMRDVRHAAGFPGLARRSPLVARWLRLRLFLSGDSAAFDLLLVGLAAAVARRRAWPLVAALPWVWFRGHRALRQAHGDPVRAAVVLAGYLGVDATILASLLRGSLRHRRLVL